MNWKPAPDTTLVALASATALGGCSVVIATRVPSVGITTVSSAATGVYRPTSGFRGVDTFSYRPVHRIKLRNSPPNAATIVKGAPVTVTVRVVKRVRLAATYAGASDDRGEIIRLYLAVLNRAPDRAGFNFWLARHQSGTPLETVAAAFADSSEFLGDTGALNDWQFVTLMYHKVFIRNPDAAGLEYWVGQLGNGTSRARLIVLFANGSEFKAFTGTS
jgi:hypothetical protein